MPSKIRIKMGAVEIEYEGTDEFLKEELLDMIKAVAEMYREAAEDSGFGSGDESGSGAGGSDASQVEGTTNQIATALGGVSKGADLILAAGVKLHFVAGKDTFTRKELLDEAKTATKFYKKSYGSNLSSILQTLVGSSFNEPSANTYALTDSATSAAKAKLVK